MNLKLLIMALFNVFSFLKTRVERRTFDVHNILISLWYSEVMEIVSNAVIYIAALGNMIFLTSERYSWWRGEPIKTIQHGLSRFLIFSHTWFRPIFLLACLNYRVICHIIGKDTWQGQKCKTGQGWPHFFELD